MGVSDLLNRQQASRSVGRLPVWTAQDRQDPASPPGPPDATVSSLGVALESGNSVVSLARVVQRLDPAKRRGEVSITSFSHPTTYRVTVNGTTHDYATLVTDDATTVAEELRDLINAGAQNARVTASVSDGISPATSAQLFTGEVLLIKSKTPIPSTGLNTLATSIQAGAGTIDDRIEPETTEFKLHVRAKDLPAALGDQFDPVDGGHFVLVNGENWTNRLFTSGMEKGYTELISADGWPLFLWGPGGLEENAEGT